MKHIITILLITLFYSCGEAQTIVDMKTSHQVNWDRKSGQNYLKDVSGFFNDFTGTWKYEYGGNKEFRITLTKVEMYHVNETWGSNFFNDGLLISYQKYEDGNLIYQSITDNYPTGIAKQQGKLTMSFTDYERYESIFDLELTLEYNLTQGQNNTPTQLYFSLQKWNSQNRYHEEHPNEPFFSVPNDIVMTKVD